MIDIETLSYINDWLRSIFLAYFEVPFGEINILLCEDFFQLPLVDEKPLYTTLAKSISAIKGS